MHLLRAAVTSLLYAVARFAGYQQGRGSLSLQAYRNAYHCSRFALPRCCRYDASAQQPKGSWSMDHGHAADAAAAAREAVAAARAKEAAIAAGLPLAPSQSTTFSVNGDSVVRASAPLDSRAAEGRSGGARRLAGALPSDSCRGPRGTSPDQICRTRLRPFPLQYSGQLGERHHKPASQTSRARSQPQIPIGSAYLYRFRSGRAL